MESTTIDRHGSTLRKLLALIFVYMGLADLTPDAERLLAVNGAGQAKGFEAMGEAWTMSRRFHSIVSKLLLPVEAATRRLIIALAADLPNPKLRPSEIRRRKQSWTAPKSFKLPRTFVPGITVPAFLFARAKPEPKPPVRMPRFCLFDPLKHFDRKRRPAQRSLPRILTFDTEPTPLPVKIVQTPYDRIPNRHLMRRVTALAHALDNLQHHAQRFARWRASRDIDMGNPKRHRDARRRLYALRPGLPPGSAPRRLPRDRYREQHVVLAETDWLARQSRERRDSS